MIKYLLRTAICTGFISVASAADKISPEKPVEIGLNKQLLVDDYIVAEKQNLTRSVGNVVKANDGKPLVFTRTAADGSIVKPDVGGLFVSSYFDPIKQRFGLWNRSFFSGPPHLRTYWESTDGIHFNFVSHLEGLTTSGDTNFAVTVDEHETNPAERFKIGYDCEGRVHAAALAHSADGIHWTPYNEGKPVTYRASDYTNQITWDPAIQAYRLFTRTDFGWGGGPFADTVHIPVGSGKMEVRGVRSMINRDLKGNPADWKLEHHFLLDGDEQLSADRAPIEDLLKDPHYLERARQEALRRQIYFMTDWLYEGVHFGLMTVYEYPADISEGTATDHVTRHERCVLNYYFATSRDGVSWNFHWVYAGQPLVPRGGTGAWDKDMVSPASEIITHDDRHWIYYGGINERHPASEKKVGFKMIGGTGLAHLRLDGFVALEAGKQRGYVVTKPFKLEGKHLELNVDASGSGRVRVEVLDATGKPIRKFSGKNAREYAGIDQLRQQPAWKGQTDLSALVGQVVRLRIQLDNARLYAFQVRQ